MQTFKVPAQTRQDSGKGAARRLRRENLIPAVVYGKELGARSVAVGPKELLSVLGSEYGRNSVIELDISGESAMTVLLSDYQYHPVSRQLLHADFLQIHTDRPVDVDVPFELEGKSKGVVLGGLLRQVYRKLPLRCLPGQIPVKITHDITELDLDETVPVSALKLPEGVSVRLPETQTVAAIVAVKVRGGEEETPTAAAGAAGAGAPAAAGAKPAKG